jgi:hypothetical protein
MSVIAARREFASDAVSENDHRGDFSHGVKLAFESNHQLTHSPFGALLVKDVPLADASGTLQRVER